MRKSAVDRSRVGNGGLAEEKRARLSEWRG